MDVKKTNKKHLKKVIYKNGRDIKVSNRYVEGFITIKEISLGVETKITIDYKGKLYFRFCGKTKWYDTSVLNENISSTIVLNKIIRRGTFNDINIFLRHFNLKIKDIQDIKKVMWVENAENLV
jgi:hypothetical protein